MWRNIRLTIAFDGTEFGGWQRQRHGQTIQGEIEKNLALITAAQVTLHGAGRTDAGVHAEAMTAHFATPATINCQSLVRALNSLLPAAIRIIKAEEVSADFHARYSATGKRYAYTIQTAAIQSPFERLYAVQVVKPLDFAAMRSCLAILIGTHDFSSFENSGSRDRSRDSVRGAVRTIVEARLSAGEGQKHTFLFSGDGFLRSMVRNIVGTVLEAGKGKISPADFAAILQAKDRNLAGPAAPAHGLVLKEVFYGPPTSEGLRS